ncbi:esterase/lipase family protein [Caballeronia sordidicola]|uniref:esterase/lipase family protein n=1 Tax=Caballeronia sordidicola TaxID=196367 RepID=UPI00068B4F44|nr:hypothetical protein [Caballeronia sordidicola]
MVDSQLKVVWDWAGRGSERRKSLLDPQATDVYTDGKLPSGMNLNDDELKRRGWGEVAFMSYGPFFKALQTALNDVGAWESGHRAELMKETAVEPLGVPPLTLTEVASSYRYQLPLHAVGYNWLGSNTDSAQRLQQKIEEFKSYYVSKGFKCDSVILLTHSMGGLVSRFYSECLGGNAQVAGVVHGVMPATGSATAYKRVKAGTELPAGIALGLNAAQMTAVFAQSPGPLQLLPTPEYGMDWLKIRDGENVFTLPKADPYVEIYAARGRWWSLCDENLINPLDVEKKNLDSDWSAFARLITESVMTFHKRLAGEDGTGLYHRNTYAFYGDDVDHATWGDVVWERDIPILTRMFGSSSAIDDPASGEVLKDRGYGYQTLSQVAGGKLIKAMFKMQAAGENGDGTVPIRSGKAPTPKAAVCLGYSGVDHEGAYKKPIQQSFALWAITKIADSVHSSEHGC